MKNIYVGNISFQTTEQDLDAAFSAYGQVERVQIVKDRETGQARGFAFVEMPDNGDADKAMAALNGAELGGRALTVNEARPREPRTGGGGGFGGNRSGGGGGGGGYAGGGGGVAVVRVAVAAVVADLLVANPAGKGFRVLVIKGSDRSAWYIYSLW